MLIILLQYIYECKKNLNNYEVLRVKNNYKIFITVKLTSKYVCLIFMNIFQIYIINNINAFTRVKTYPKDSKN